MIKSRNLYLFNVFMFLFLFILQVLDNILKERMINNFYISNIKNVFLIFISAFYLIQIVQKYYLGKKLIFKKEALYVFIWAFSLLTLSLFFSLSANEFTIKSLFSVLKILLPVILGFLILNTLSYSQIRLCMTFILIINLLGFFFAMGIEKFSFNSLFSISFLESYSPLESNFFSPQALALCCFFLYYRESKIISIISIIFLFLTFKRFMILFAIFTFVISAFINLNKKIRPIWITLAKVVIVVGCLGYILALQGNFDDMLTKYIHINMDQLTMGRAALFGHLGNHFQSFGLESSSVVIGRDIEMDLIKIFMELSIWGLIITINQIFNLGKKNVFTFLLSLLILLEMLTSHFYDITYFWILFYITLGCINYKETETRNLNTKKICFKFK